MAHVVDVAAYILEDLGCVSSQKLQKRRSTARHITWQSMAQLFFRKRSRLGLTDLLLPICSGGIEVSSLLRVAFLARE